MALSLTSTPPVRVGSDPKCNFDNVYSTPGLYTTAEGDTFGASVHMSKFSKRRSYAPDPTSRVFRTALSVSLGWPKENVRKTFAEEVLGNERMRDAED